MKIKIYNNDVKQYRIKISLNIVKGCYEKLCTNGFEKVDKKWLMSRKPK